MPYSIKKIPSVSRPPIARVIEPQIAGPAQYLKIKKKFSDKNIAVDAPINKTCQP